MKLFEKNNIPASAAIEVVYIIFFISVFFSFRAISSISIGILLIAGFIKQKGRVIPTLRNNRARLLLAGCLIFLLLLFISLLYTDNITETLRDIQHKSGLALIPLAVILTVPFTSGIWKTFLSAYCLPLLGAAIYCLCMTFLQYRNNGDSSVFFYHKLVSPLNQHAVYFSVFVFIGLLLLLDNMQKKYYVGGYTGSLSIIIFFSGFLFLLSSKLVISFYIFCLLYYLISLAKRNIFPRKMIVGLISLILIGVSIIFLTRNPIRERFLDIMNGNLALVRQDKYTPGDYFNGIQFRLLQWKFTAEILNENHSWLTGVGPGNAQHFLDQKYISKNMYIGEPARGDHGYLGYNTHNQFLETLLKTGIGGLVILLFICFSLIKMAWQKKKRQLSFTIALVLAWLFTESVLERQYGIIIITFFPVFLSLDEK